LVFSKVFGSSFTLIGTPTISDTPRAPINGIELVKTDRGEVVIDEGLVAHWAFDDSYADSGGVFNGEPRGTEEPVFVPGAFGSAIRLNGEDQFVEITGGDENDLEFPGGDMSIAGWFRVAAFDTSWQCLISKGEGTNYRVARRGDTDKIAYAGGVGEAAEAAPSVNDGAWHHFAAISDSTTSTRFWIDGVLWEESTAPPVLDQSDFNLMIGENPGATGREWEGDIDDIAIWNRVLTPSEVVALAGNSVYGIINGVSPAAPAFTAVSIVDGQMTIEWDRGTLQSAPTVSGPWTNVTFVPGRGQPPVPAESPFVTPTTGTIQIFRLVL
jgi:hypothetical protein